MTKRQNDSTNFNYLNGGGNLSKIIKTAAATTILLLLIIWFTSPPFPIILLLIAIAVTINSYVIGMTKKQYLKGLIYALIYATVLHYMFKLAGKFGLIGIIVLFGLVILFKFYRIKKRLTKTFEKVITEREKYGSRNE